MNKTILKCNKCGLIKQVFGSIDKEDSYCPICEVQMEAEDTLLNEALQLDSIQQLKGHIKELGNKRVWEIIEAFGKVKTRIAYRNLFFKAGGKIE